MTEEQKSKLTQRYNEWVEKAKQANTDSWELNYLLGQMNGVGFVLGMLEVHLEGINRKFEEEDAE